VTRDEIVQALAAILVNVDALSSTFEKVEPLVSKVDPGAPRTMFINLLLAASAERERQMDRARALLRRVHAEVERECGAEDASKHFAAMEARHKASRATYGEWREALASLAIVSPMSAA
jgi:hypothetical protein